MKFSELEIGQPVLAKACGCDWNGLAVVTKIGYSDDRVAVQIKVVSQNYDTGSTLTRELWYECWKLDQYATVVDTLPIGNDP